MYSTIANASLRHATDMLGRWFSILAICVLLVGLLPTSLVAASVPANTEPIVVRYEFSEPIISEAGDYHAVHIEGLTNLDQPGQPRLPIKAVKLLVPFDQEVAQVRVIPGQKVTLQGTYLVEPGQEPVPLSRPGPYIPTLPAPEVYGAARSFPGELHSPAMSQGRKGYRILVLTLYPVEYLPQSGALSYYESLTVHVELRSAPWAPDAVKKLRYRSKQWSADRSEVCGLVDNPAALAAYPTSTHLERVRRGGPAQETAPSLTPSPSYDYVIITNEALMAAPGPYNFQALKADKEARGISTLITTTEWIAATYDGTRPDGGSDLQTKIRNFVLDAYQTWGIGYVLLGGDGDGGDVGGESGDTIIPHRGFCVYRGSYTDYDIPADMYYACLDGTFDDDADGIYAEWNDGPGGGEVDLYAEVYVGRAPVDSNTELSNFVRKTLAYQADNDSYLHEVWMVGEKLSSTPTWGGDYKDEVKEGASTNGYTTVGFGDSPHAPFFNMHMLYDRDQDPESWAKSETIAAINSPAHLVNHMGHANATYVMRMSNSDVDGSLTNDHYFIGYSQGCYAGAFDNRYSSGSYSSSDSIGEHLIGGTHGAVAFVSNSRYGWYQSVGTNGSSQYYDRQFWDAILGENIFNVGRANQDSKEDTYGFLGPGGFTSSRRWAYYELNLFGDPELMVKTSAGPGLLPTLEISEEDNPDPVPAGEVLTYTLTVHNTGNVPATGVVVTDTVPVHTTFRDAESGGTLVGNEVHWTGHAVNAGDSLVLRFSVTVDQSLPQGTVLVNDRYGVQCAEGAAATGDAVTTVVDSMPNVVPNLEISKVGSPGLVQAGGVLTYTLTVRNTGHIPAIGVVVTDTVPTHTAFRCAADGGALVGNEVRWTGHTVNAGESLVLRFSVTVEQPLPAGTTSIVNSNYGVRSAEGVAATSGPVTTGLRHYEVFLPLVRR